VLEVACLLVVTFLYLGNFLIPTVVKHTYLTEVYGRRAAIKISNDEWLDRSLYYTGRRALVYTRFDGTPVGSARRYRALHGYDGDANRSFHEPASFEWR
jgi:hypothetical protein